MRIGRRGLLAVLVPAGARVTIGNFAFLPATLTVPAGSRVVWTNEDDMPHSIVGADVDAGVGGLRSPALDTGDVFGFVFMAAGEYRYVCGLHPHMRGRVIVT